MSINSNLMSNIFILTWMRRDGSGMKCSAGLKNSTSQSDRQFLPGDCQMALSTRCSLRCPICTGEFDWNEGYGREIRCCCESCHTEAEWRRTLSILGKEYYPDPRRKNDLCTTPRTR